MEWLKGEEGKGWNTGGRGPDVLMSATSLNASLAHDYLLSRGYVLPDKGTTPLLPNKLKRVSNECLRRDFDKCKVSWTKFPPSRISGEGE